MDIDDDDFLSHLPAEAFAALESDAIQFTQAVARRGQPSQELYPVDGQYGVTDGQYELEGGGDGADTDYNGVDGEYMDGKEGDKTGKIAYLEDDDLDTTEVTNELAVPVGRPVGDKSLPQQTQRLPQYAPQMRRPPQSQMRPPALSQMRPPLSQIRPPLSQMRPPLSQMRPPSQFLPSQTNNTTTNNITDIASMHMRIRKLEEELNAARGEVAIIRANSTKAARNHDEEVARLRKQSQEQLAEREKAMAAAVAAHRTAATDLEFLKQDVRDAHSRTTRRKAGTEAESAATAITTTPKKTLKQWRSEAVGFDDLDLVHSPSRRRRLDRTPGKGKRKRDLLDSPTGALDLDTEVELRAYDKEEPEGATTTESVQPTFEYLLFLLDHGIPGTPPTFDALAHVSLPSAPGLSFAQLIIHKLPLMGDAHRPIQLLVDFAEFAIGLWGQCYDEGVLHPAAGHLVALLEFVLQLHATTVAPLVVRSAVPVAFASLYVVVEGRSRGVELEGVDSTRVLGLLCTLATACAALSTEASSGDTSSISSSSPIATFWSLVPMDMVYPLFSPRQHLDDVLVTLDLLSTSALSTSIGPIDTDSHSPSHKDDERHTRHSLISHVSAKLVEVSRCTALAPDRHRLRLAALRALSSFVASDYGARAIAVHDTAIPRIVTLLSASIDELYDTDMLSPSLESSSSLLRIIASATLLIHTLATSPRTASLVDMQARLAASHGGPQRYLVALARLNFADDDGVLEAGIGADASACAHELLEMAVTLEEGDDISAAFLKWE